MALLDIENFDAGLELLKDSSKSSIGSSREMYNILITDRGGLAKRPGTTLLGSLSNSQYGLKGLFNFVKSFGSSEVLLRSYDDELEYFHPTLRSWTRLKSGFTVGQEFGFKEHLVNTENEDYVYFCNRTENYQRWSAAITQLNGALAGGEAAITVDGVLKDAVFESGTGTASSTTTLTDSSKTWASSQWIGFYIEITSGLQSGQIRAITANTSNQLTFDSMTDPGNATYRIRMPKFPASGTLIIDGQTVAYTAIPTTTTFTVSSAPVAADNSPVTLVPTEYPAAPRGNRLETHYTRMIVGNVRSALSRDSGGTLKGSQSTGSYYVSKLKNATDFSFAATRNAGEGDVVSTPYGGGDITDVVNHEDQFYVFKERYVEAAKYTQDSTDIITRTQLKTGFGSINRAIKAKDDIYFVTADKQITSIGRIQMKSDIPQTTNIGLVIKRLLDTFDFTQTQGIEYKQRIFITCKASEDDDYNNRVIVFNKATERFEGVWQLSAFGFVVFEDGLYYGDASSPNIYKMFDGVNDTYGSDTFSISSTWKSNFMNLTPGAKHSSFAQQSICGFGVEGYITPNTNIQLELYKDFQEDAVLSFTFGGTEEEFLDNTPLSAFLGDNPLGLAPMGSVTATSDGRYHFQFIVYFPEIYSNFISIGLINSGKDQDFEITRFSLDMAYDPMIKAQRIKSN